MTDFNNTNILDFIPTQGWSEDQKISFSLKFVELYFVFLSKALDESMPVDVDPKLEELLKTNPSEQQVVKFYNELLPNLGDVIEAQAMKFKKIFLLNLYSDKLVNLEKQGESEAYNNWKKINDRAIANKWDEVLELVGQLK